MVPITLAHVRRFTALPGDQQRALLLALALIPVTSVCVQLFGLRRCHSWVEARKTSEGAAAIPASVQRRFVAAAARYGLWRGNCLSQSLVLLLLLRRSGLQGNLRIGVRRSGSVLEAHAWVDLDGRPLNDAPDVTERYSAFVNDRDVTRAPFV